MKMQTIIAGFGGGGSTSATLTPVQVIYAGGQSNFSGLGQISALTSGYRAPFPQVQVWNPYTFRFEALQAGVNELGLKAAILTLLGSPGYEDGFGAEIAFAKAWTDAHPNGEVIYLIKYGTNTVPTSSQGASIALWNSTLYPVYKDEITLAHEWLNAHGKRPVPAFMWWCQGEAESSNVNYLSDLTAIVANKFRPDFLGNAKLAIIKTGDSNIRSLQADYHTANPSNTVLVETSDLLSISGNPLVAGTIEGIHYNCAAQLLIGARLYSAVYP